MSIEKEFQLSMVEGMKEGKAKDTMVRQNQEQCRSFNYKNLS